nr:cytochrome b [Pegophysema philippiana]
MCERKQSMFMKMITQSVYDLPVSKNLNIWWNFGSLMGLCLSVQLVSGIFLAMHYTPDVEMAFSSVTHIMRDVNGGWLIRSIHANGASFFFLCIYMHIGRGIYYGSYLLTKVWSSGVTLLIMLMATAFLGYVLPWGQMSYWGATVITNLVTAVPYIGKTVLYWLWGGYTVGNPTLVRFYVLHFMLAFAMAVVVVVHMVLLHEEGSNNPLGSELLGDKVPFHMYFTLKDIVGFLVMGGLMLFICLATPDIFMDAENFKTADPLLTPVHIQPEWYFLFAYAILRSIPNKTGGVVALLCSVLVPLVLPVMMIGYHGPISNSMNPVGAVLFWMLVGSFGVLTWIGTCPVEEPYITIGQVYTVIYFAMYFAIPAWNRLWWSRLQL